MTIHAEEYADILTSRVSRVATMLRSEGFSSGITYPIENVDSAFEDLQEIIDEVQNKRREFRKRCEGN
jgi:hypothetical protein